MAVVKDTGKWFQGHSFFVGSDFMWRQLTLCACLTSLCLSVHLFKVLLTELVNLLFIFPYSSY